MCRLPTEPPQKQQPRLCASVDGITLSGVRPVPGKVEAVQQVPAPETVSQLWSFLGMVGFFRNYIQGFAEVSASLTDLLRGVRHGRQRLPLSLDCEQSFRHLKEVLTTAPVLRHSGNVEALAAQITLSVWRPLLYGVRFELISDHASLVSLLTQKALSPRLLRLCEFLADFNFQEVRYIRGSDNVVPDFFSRPWGHSGEDAISSPLHLSSHPRRRRDEAAVSAGVQLGDDTLRYVSLLVCRGAESTLADRTENGARHSSVNVRALMDETCVGPVDWNPGLCTSVGASGGRRNASNSRSI